MTRANSMYLGWGNPRTALKVDKCPVVILVDPTNGHKVLEGQPALDFQAELTELSHHLCGIKASTRIQSLLASVQHSDDDAYDVIFDRYFQ